MPSIERSSYLLTTPVLSVLFFSITERRVLRGLVFYYRDMSEKVGDIVLCSWARHFTLTVPLSTQVYKWVPANCWGNLAKLRGSDLQWTSIPSRGSRNTSSRFMLQKPG